MNATSINKAAARDAIKGFGTDVRKAARALRKGSVEIITIIDTGRKVSVLNVTGTNGSIIGQLSK